jgi:hypothetical protein
VNQLPNVKSIEIFYLEKGHTLIRADSVHDHIGRAIKKQENIYNFDDLTELISNIHKNLYVHRMTEQDFLNWPGKPKGVKKLPKLNLIRMVKIERGLCRVNTVRKKTLEVSMSLQIFTPVVFWCHAQALPRPGYDSRKRQEIIDKLCPLMPPSKRLYNTIFSKSLSNNWTNLPISVSK